MTCVALGPLVTPGGELPLVSRRDHVAFPGSPLRRLPSPWLWRWGVWRSRLPADRGRLPRLCAHLAGHAAVQSALFGRSLWSACG